MSALDDALTTVANNTAMDTSNARAELAQLRKDAEAADTEHAKLVELSDLYQQLRDDLDKARTALQNIAGNDEFQDMQYRASEAGGLRRVAAAWLKKYPEKKP
jgi:uncharacterized phage infection (PIP) family protein YhgE